MDLQILMPWIAAVLAITTLITNLYTFFTSPSRKNSIAIERIIHDQVEHDRRIQRLEDTVKSLPSRDAAHQLELSMKDLAGRLDTFDERLRTLSVVSTRLQEFLLEQAKGR